MSISSDSRKLPLLKRIDRDSRHVYRQPSKQINDEDDLRFFFASTAYRDISEWILQLNRAMFPRRRADGKITVYDVASPPPLSNTVCKLRDLLEALSDLIAQAPPDTGPRRFGNVAFRKWYQLLEDSASSLLDTYLSNANGLLFGADSDQRLNQCDELKAYLLGSFGSAPRLDYGTGHELSFLAFLGCLWKLWAFEDGEEAAIVLGVIQPYLTLVRKLIKTYTLEPAGSHGVWGLDDHSFVPYIFGSAQFGPAIPDGDPLSHVPTEGSLPSAPGPSGVTSTDTVAEYKDANMYFSAIQFIFDVKKGPFWEHSPVLYNISGIKDGWGKINKGMLKMYAAEVLGKFPVVQHFPFGSLFQWEADATALPLQGSLHPQQTPPKVQGRDSTGAGAANTAAPWSRTGPPAVAPANAGFAAMRAPWASRSGDGHHATLSSSRNPTIPPGPAPRTGGQR